MITGELDNKITTKAMKLNSYKSCVVPIVSYGSSLLKPSKRDLKINESVQKKATAWITSPIHLSDREMVN